MPFNPTCFRECVKKNTKWYTWVAIGIVAVAAFLLALLSWGLAAPAAIGWAVAVVGASIGGILAMCWNKCR